VSNAFDAGAMNVHVILPADFIAEGATIVVVDDGTGMDEQGLNEHWLIGVSHKRDTSRTVPKGRKQIGKFGIGKLATYVLASRLTHISKVRGKYYSTSMDYSQIPAGAGGAIHEEKVFLPLHELTEKEARAAIDSLVSGTKPGYKAIKLFGSGAAKSWTVAIMSDLKQMATEIQRGRLRWILQSAMPLRDDFTLFLNGEKVPPSKLAAAKVGRWVLGRDLRELPTPAPDLEPTDDPKAGKDARFGLTHPELGRITGYVEVYEDPLDAGKSTEIERSNGFFVYVRGRLVNIDDPGFGINRNLLRHGTFSRFRMVAYIDRLDEELRSSREAFREGPLFAIAQNVLHGAFNFARTALDKHEAQQVSSERIGNRIAGSPGSLTRRPIVGLVQSAMNGTAHPRYISLPAALKKDECEAFLSDLKGRADTEDGLVGTVETVEMSQEEGLTKLDIESGTLRINSLHPFVAYFLDEYEDKKRSLPLELLALSEILLEAHLYEVGLDEDVIHDILARRDESLRFLARSTGKKNARAIAQDLVDAAGDKDALEKALVAAFDSMGFDAVPLGGPGKPDGFAEARLAGDAKGPNRYSVSLEAKSKETPGAKVSAKTVGISAIARQRDDYKCDHAVVVGPDFPTTTGDMSALVKEIKSDNKATGKTVTLIRVVDMGRLIRLVPLKRTGLGRLRDFFASCQTPEESKAWVDALAIEQVSKPPYRRILDEIWDLQKQRPDEAVEYSGLAVALQKSVKSLNLSKTELHELCVAMSRMAPEMISARKTSVELSQKPDRVMALIGSVIGEYPEEETKGITI
ncbi:MAG TPA: ATP-binding protein, partial [Terriglobia bacterium]|nr:ATP-binding protein [Terriglobia bacterium]